MGEMTESKEILFVIILNILVYVWFTHSIFPWLRKWPEWRCFLIIILSYWKTIEFSFMDDEYCDLMWRSYAPESLLNKLHCTQLPDSLRTWYIHRDRACQEIHNVEFSGLGFNQCLWFNKTKRCIYYKEWFD